MCVCGGTAAGGGGGVCVCGCVCGCVCMRVCIDEVSVSSFSCW